MDFLDQGFQKLKHYRQTDTQTDATKNITTPRFAAGKLCLQDIVRTFASCAWTPAACNARIAVSAASIES